MLRVVDGTDESIASRHMTLERRCYDVIILF